MTKNKTDGELQQSNKMKNYIETVLLYHCKKYEKSGNIPCMRDQNCTTIAEQDKFHVDFTEQIMSYVCRLRNGQRKNPCELIARKGRRENNNKSRSRENHLAKHVDGRKISNECNTKK